MREGPSTIPARAQKDIHGRERGRAAPKPNLTYNLFQTVKLAGLPALAAVFRVYQFLTHLSNDASRSVKGGEARTTARLLAAVR